MWLVFRKVKILESLIVSSLCDDSFVSLKPLIC